MPILALHKDKHYVTSVTSKISTAAGAPLSFAALGLIEPLLRALSAKSYATPTPIQAQAIPPLLAGADLIGIAQTGTGKTAAFGLPIMQNLAAAHPHGGPRALVLAPTRELALQIGDEFAAYGRHLGLRSAVIVGGVSQRPQVANLARGVDILIATPGRLLDLFGQRRLRLDRVSVLVLDEADRMLDMGFIHAVRRIVAALPKQRQTALFSATMPDEVVRLASQITASPQRVEVTPPARTVDRVAQHVFFVETANKLALLDAVLDDPALSRVLVFSRTKHRANRVADYLGRNGIAADAIHGNKSQSARQRALERFKSGRVRVLVATDIAARGIDVDDVTHVINYELPNEPESYVHRIGRTARAGAAGAAFSFCDRAERAYLRDIEKLICCRLDVVADQPFHSGDLPETGNVAKLRKRAGGIAQPVAKRRRRSAGRNGRRAA